MLRSEVKALKEADKALKPSAKTAISGFGGNSGNFGYSAGARDTSASKNRKQPSVGTGKGEQKGKSGQGSSRKKDARSPPQSGSKSKPADKMSAPAKGMLSSLLDGPDKDSSKSRAFFESRRKLIKKVVKSLTESYSIAIEQAEDATKRLESAICTAIDEDQRVTDTDTAVRCYSNKIIELITAIKSGTVELQKFISKQEDSTR